MKADSEFFVTDFALLARPDGNGFVVRGETVDQLPSGPQRSGKYIHLTMTPKQAASLLAHLQAAQKQFGFPIAPPSDKTAVPPAKDRN